MAEHYHKISRVCNASGFKAIDIASGKAACPVEGNILYIKHHSSAPNLVVKDGVDGLNEVCGGECSHCGAKATRLSGVVIENSMRAHFRIIQHKGGDTLEVSKEEKN